MSKVVLSIGIDPGMYGAVAGLLFHDGDLIDARILRRDKLTDYEMACELRGLLSLGGKVDHRGPLNGSILIALEKTSVAPPKKGMFTNLASIQKQCASGGFYQGVLAAYLADYQIPYGVVPARTWQQPLGLIKTNKNEAYSAKKKRHREAAQRLYPSLHCINETSDAILIAHWGFFHNPLSAKLRTSTRARTEGTTPSTLRPATELKIKKSNTVAKASRTVKLPKNKALRALRHLGSSSR